ncbi:EmrA/EmrK family multidrug efflux transporter periplasmic adaptor subunit [Limnohabitans sp. JirII-29]|uniref:HlyD family secretion protein n=1 Tax=Limnohabitans sp. JirII-29 TaxID=1835756 RepID=UPI000D36B6F9|nr:efflux RND transporter periplasmic adaptor subunit [Limnohabitans sp. JirII-29]PUE28509.1 EmrA/EmrK family multidrug efflux transporter periplasmic adaptor subunit [Limnohabitans sp. JirII-29]
MSQLSANEKANARRRGLQAIAATIGVAALVWGGWHWVSGRHHVSTDNAYVMGHVLQITPQITGTVVAIQADETDFVRAGQVLVKLDASDARVALEQAQAQLAQTVREARALFANTGALAAQVKLREADVQRAQTDVQRTQDDVNRRAPLVPSGAVSQEEFQHISAQLSAAKSGLNVAQAALDAAKEQFNAGQTQTEGTRIESHPSVARAAAKMREAYLALQRVNLLAPIDGHIAKRSVQVGQRVSAGAPLMTLVALNQLWVDANFKESQLNELHIGQSAELEADVYGHKVTFHGKVAGLGAGTGSAFSLLPAQNATGNWIKVVQRVPVRIVLDPQELAQHPLRVGLSMDVTVDTADQSGKNLADTRREGAVSSTAIYDTLQAAADAEVQRTIAANLGTHSAKP